MIWHKSELDKKQLTVPLSAINIGKRTWKLSNQKLYLVMNDALIVVIKADVELRVIWWT